MERRIINPWTWQDQFGFVQAVEVKNPTRTLVCSGQTPVDANGTVQHAGDMAAQVGLAAANVGTVLEQAGFAWKDVVKLTVYATDIDALFTGFAPLAELLGREGCQTAMTVLGVASLAFPGQMIEIEATAMA
jgi:enamine deaminase RidA (YjgF/YER057c/UK114 family)